MISDSIILSEAEARRLVLDFYDGIFGVEREMFEAEVHGVQEGKFILAEMRDALRRRDDERNGET